MERECRYLIILRLNEINPALNGDSQFFSQHVAHTAITWIIHSGKLSSFTLKSTY